MEMSGEIVQGNTKTVILLNIRQQLFLEAAGAFYMAGIKQILFCNEKHKFQKQDAGAKLVLVSAFLVRSNHGLAAVQNGLADFAILAEGASVPDSLTAQKIDEIQEIPICGPAFLELTEEPVSLKRLADYPIISLTEGTSSHDFYAELFLRHGLSFSPDVEVETTAQVPPVVQSDLGVGFVPREMLYGTPEASGIYPIMLEEPIPARSVFLFQRKTQPLSIAAKKLRQMLLEDAPQESGK